MKTHSPRENSTGAASLRQLRRFDGAGMLGVMCALAFALNCLADESGVIGEFRRDQPGARYCIRRGASRFDVYVELGRPDERLGPDLWVYWDCQATSEKVNRLGFDTLVVRFEADRVAELKLTDGRVVRALLARQRIGLNQGAQGRY